MKKLVLNLEELAVESFETQAPGEKLGTVFAQETEVGSDCRYSICTCVISDCYACWEGATGDYACVHTGFQTCATCRGDYEC